MRGLFVTGTGTEVGKTVVAAALALHARGAGRARRASSSRRSAGWTTIRSARGLAKRTRAAATTPCCGSPRDRSRATTRSLRTATGRRSRPTSPPSWPASRSTRTLLRGAALAATEGADMLVCEGVGGFLVPLDAGLPGPRPRPGPRPAGRRGRSTGLGTINHTLLTLEAVRAGRARVVRRGPHALARSSRRRSSGPTARRSSVSASCRVQTLPRLDLSEPASLAGAPHAGRLAARDEQPARCVAQRAPAGTASSAAASSGIAATASSAASCVSTRLFREPRISSQRDDQPGDHDEPRPAASRC